MKHQEDVEKASGKTDEFSRVKELLGVNKAAALGLAVVLTVSTTLTGCTSDWNDDQDEEDDSYYTSGSGHYFYPGGSFGGSSWSKSVSGISSSKYTSTRAGSIGG